MAHTPYRRLLRCVRLLVYASRKRKKEGHESKQWLAPNWDKEMSRTKMHLKGGWHQKERGRRVGWGGEGLIHWLLLFRRTGLVASLIDARIRVVDASRPVNNLY
jgi:hypothetical protein